MNFKKITVFLNEEDIELLTCNLTELGAEGFEIGGGEELERLIDSTDPDLIDEEVFQQRNAPVSVTVYIPENEQGRGIVSAITEFLHARGLEYTTGKVAEEDWANNWKACFKPIPIGSRLVVKPSWCEYNNADNRVVLEIDPASAFGTGQHATTRMCLELLEKYITGGEAVLDLGCGSGILSAAAGLLGAKHVAAVDICQNSARVAGETLELNKVDSFEVICADILNQNIKTEHDFDLVIANITADVIIAMSELFPQYTAQTLILSGVIAHRLPEVLAVIEESFIISETREQEGWIGLVCVKKQRDFI
jgi:ribosomal protein L11 methyltransferase